MTPIFGNLNLFQATADASHLIAMLIFVVSIWKKKSCEGISGKTQILHGLVFTSRYLDLFYINVSFYTVSYYLSSAKVTFILITYFTVFSIYWQFRSEKNRDMDSFRAEILVLPVLGLAFLYNHEFSVLEIAWTFSQYLESVAVIPQLYVIKKSGHAEYNVVYYLLALAAYKSLYICNWIYKYYNRGYYDEISTYSGCLQTLILFVGVWLAHSANWKPQYKDLVPQVAIIPSPLVKMDTGDEADVQVIPVVADLAQSENVCDADEKTPLYSPHT